jgi:Enoyl-CoA hydratase/isomerase
VSDGHDDADHADVVIEHDVASLDDVLATIEANPIAATTLALLLRGADARTVDDGLVAESAAYSMLQAGPEFRRWRERRPRKVHFPDADPVLTSRDGHELVITLNRPHVRNALNVALRDALLEALAIAQADDSITSVVLRGNGASYSTGGDLDEFGTFPDPARAHLIRLATSIGRVLHELRDRVTVEMHGVCAGSGIELPAFVAHIVADADTTFSLPEVNLGLIPGAGGTVSLPRRIGPQRTALLALSSAAIDAPTALDWGLIDEIR